ncbi:hypothetical protein LIER_34337 [Lithospermum erythrorhizon]|uniref:Bet v I/Major latex protein domain-containing protein n=1 Tax=Lithospermum erythrorhizon TaxID=34254 RepID=A0AAV3S1F3_LITER
MVVSSILNTISYMSCIQDGVILGADIRATEGPIVSTFSKSKVDNLGGGDSKKFEISDDNLVFKVIRYGPSYASKLTPGVQGCDLIDGQWGNVGSVICWTFTNDGKRCTTREIITAIDETKKLIEYKVIGGELMDAFKSVLITFQSTNNSATWTIEYEKINECIPNPTSFLEFLVKAIKDIDLNHKLIPRLSANN